MHLSLFKNNVILNGERARGSASSSKAGRKEAFAIFVQYFF